MTELGETYSGRFDVLDSDGNPAAAGAVTVAIDLPDGTTKTSPTDFTVTFTSPNHYDFDYVPTQIGRHVVRASATGGAALGGLVRKWPPDVFHVDDASTAVLLVGLAEVKAQLNITKDDIDEELLGVIAKASAAVEDHSQLWHRATIVETFPRVPRRALVLSKRPVVSITSLVDNGVTLDPAGYAPAGQILTPAWGYPAWSPGAGQLVVTYVAGTNVIPQQVRQAVVLMCEHLWSTQRGPARPSTSADDYDPRYSYSFPRRVAELLGDPLPGFA